MENQQLPRGRRTKALNEAIETLIEVGMTSMGENNGFDYEDAEFTYEDISMAYRLIVKKMLADKRWG